MKMLIIAAAAFSLAAPAAAVAQSRAAVVAVDEGANGRTIRLRRGQELVVSVQACVACPYAWAVAARPRVLTGLGTQEVDMTPRGGATPMVGGNKIVKYRFRAVRAGRGTLQLANRPFTGGAGDGRTLRINVLVR